jgi:mycothiol system anti-sigma-R factor
MIDCNDAADLIYRFLDKELSQDDVRHLEEHLKMCKHCFGHLAFDRSLRELVQKQSAKNQIPPHLKESILKALNQEA